MLKRNNYLIFLISIFLISKSNGRDYILMEDPVELDTASIVNRARLLTASRYSNWGDTVEIPLILSRKYQICQFEQPLYTDYGLIMDSSVVENFKEHFLFIRIENWKFDDSLFAQYSIQRCGECAYLIAYSIDLHRYFRIYGFEFCDLCELQNTFREAMRFGYMNVMEVSTLIKAVNNELKFKVNSKLMKLKYIDGKRKYARTWIYPLCDSLCNPKTY